MEIVDPPRFSIGINTNKHKKISKKISKKKKKVCKKPLYYAQPPVDITFEVYSGPRWMLPKCISASESLRYKFSLLNTVFSFREIKLKILGYIRNLKFRFDISPFPQWKPPPFITSQSTSIYAKQENEWNRVRAIYFRLFKLRQALVILVFNWRIKKCLKNCKNIQDPVTLEHPRKPVTIIDFKNRISFVYDAATLKKTIENRLLLSDYMFPDPREPVNLLTNEAFTLGQLISVSNQCFLHGEYSWMIDSLKKCNGDLNMFSIYNKQRLKIEAINTFFKKYTFEIRDIVIEYFNVEADYADMPSASSYRFIKAYDTTPDRGIVQEWIGLTREYYIAKALNEPFLLIKAASRTNVLINKVYKAFQHEC